MKFEKLHDSSIFFIKITSFLLFLDPNADQKLPIPTLFGTTLDKINLAVMSIISGETVEDGFNLATKIIEDFKLRPIKVYCLAGKQFAKSERYNGITQLVNCIKSTGINDSAISDMLDEMLAQAVGTLIKANVGGTKVEDLIKLINDKATKVLVLNFNFFVFKFSCCRFLHILRRNS